MHIVPANIVVELAGDGVGLADLFRFQALTLQHVIKIGVAANIELHRTLNAYSPFPEESGQHPMNNGRTNLAFDIITNHRQVRFSKSLLPVILSGDKHWNAID